MITTTYLRTRAARKAAAAAIRARIAGAQAVALVRALRKLNGYIMTDLLERGEMVTVTQVLAQLGADADTIRRFSGWAGKHIRKTYLAMHDGYEPVQVWKVVNGKPRQVLAYVANEPALTAGLATYPRTAHLVAAPVAA